MSRIPDVATLARGVRAGDRALLGRALTLVESDRPDHREQAQELLAELLPSAGGSARVGVTGVPGVGKSTLIDALGIHLVDLGQRVAVLAVDPTSGRSGGSILGDKTRMGRLVRREGTFVRPSPTRGALGGVARKTRESLLVCEAAGYDTVIVETVGVGQSELEVASMVDCFLLLMLPNAGDELQGIKRGIMELADLVAINKADGPQKTAAEHAKRQCGSALRYLRPAHPAWTPEVHTVSARTGDGIAALWEAIGRHREALVSAGALEERRSEQALQWMWRAVEAGVRDRLWQSPELREAKDELERAVRTGEMPATRAATELLQRLGW